MNKQSLPSDEVKQSFPFADAKRKFFNSCRRCLNPWFVGAIVIAVAGLLIFVPLIGVISLIVAVPLIGCSVMCAVIVFMMRLTGEDKKS